ncbi:MAG: hypothetical protein FWE16_05450 [Firmicutes bacterium]|nr:hypothetical protein [Bacillota bacterium]
MDKTRMEMLEEFAYEQTLNEIAVLKMKLEKQNIYTSAMCDALLMLREGEDSDQASHESLCFGDGDYSSNKYEDIVREKGDVGAAPTLIDEFLYQPAIEKCKQLNKRLFQAKRELASFTARGQGK